MSQTLESEVLVKLNRLAEHHGKSVEMYLEDLVNETFGVSPAEPTGDDIENVQPDEPPEAEETFQQRLIRSLSEMYSDRPPPLTDEEAEEVVKTFEPRFEALGGQGLAEAMLLGAEISEAIHQAGGEFHNMSGHMRENRAEYAGYLTGRLAAQRPYTLPVVEGDGEHAN